MKLLDTTVLIDIDRGGSEVLNKARKLDRAGTRLTLVTANIAHFEEIEKLKVKQW